ncbi:MAG: YIP1 family protein [Candidatus Bathyarchaeia archaeon]
MEEISTAKQILGCLTFSGKAFRSIVRDPSLLKAASIIITIAAIAALAGYNYAGKRPLPLLPPQVTPTGTVIPIQPRQIRQFMMIGALVGGLVGIPLGWIINSALIHLFSRAFKGRGGFRAMLTLAGYASLPLVFQHALRLIDSFIISPERISLLEGPLQVFADPVLNSVVNNFMSTFTVFGIWSALLIVIAIRENYEFTWPKSILVLILAFSLLLTIPPLISTSMVRLITPSTIQAPHPI